MVEPKMMLPLVHQQRLDEFWDHCVRNQYFNIGYPESADFDYRSIERFLRFSLNNCGDWSKFCNYLLNTFSFEHEVMEYFADLFEIPFEKSWGYITNGGTEGNMFGCYLAREMFPESILYCSREAHYSVAKIVRLLRMQCRVVDSLPNGEIDCDALMAAILRDGERQPIILANIGTTVLGAVDDIAEIQRRLLRAGIARSDYYIHADAALSGMILPFVENPQPFSFADGVDSICVSGHKMIGSPIPCGIIVVKRENVARVSVEIDYISAEDKTISGSRNGHTPLFMWKAIKSLSRSDLERRVRHALDMAQYAVDRFRAAGVDAWRNRNSITVVFPRPSELVWKKHCLATSNDVAHLITTPHHKDSTRIDGLIDDIVADLTMTMPVAALG